MLNQYFAEEVLSYMNKITRPVQDDIPKYVNPDHQCHGLSCLPLLS